MKKLVKDIVVFVLGILAELLIYFQMPYLELRDGFGDGFMILIPVFVTPVIGLLVGLLTKRDFKWIFPIVPVVCSVPFMSVYYGQVSIEYIFIFFFGTLIGIALGWSLRKIIVSLVEKIRQHKEKK